MKLKRTIYWM